MEIGLGRWRYQWRVHQPAQKITCRMILYRTVLFVSSFCILLLKSIWIHQVHQGGVNSAKSQRVALKKLRYIIMCEVIFSLRLLELLFFRHFPSALKCCLKPFRYLVKSLKARTQIVPCIPRWFTSIFWRRSSTWFARPSLWTKLWLLNRLWAPRFFW